MECPACLRKDDCGQCEMCRDKRKFGGPGIKKQACMYVQDLGQGDGGGDQHLCYLPVGAAGITGGGGSFNFEEIS